MNKLSKKSIDKIMLFLSDKFYSSITLSRREITTLFKVYQNATSEIFELENQLQIIELENQLQRIENDCRQKDEVIDEAYIKIQQILDCYKHYKQLPPLIVEELQELQNNYEKIQRR